MRRLWRATGPRARVDVQHTVCGALTLSSPCHGDAIFQFQTQLLVTEKATMVLVDEEKGDIPGARRPGCWRR